MQPEPTKKDHDGSLWPGKPILKDAPDDSKSLQRFEQWT